MHRPTWYNNLATEHCQQERQDVFVAQVESIDS